MNKKEFDALITELNSENTLTVKRKSEILNRLTMEVNHIWRTICQESDAGIEWWSFSTDNDAYRKDGVGSDGGFFSPIQYRYFIRIIGECESPQNLYRYKDGFPTYFIYKENWKEEFIKNLNIDKIKEQEKVLKKQISDLKSRNKKKIIDKLSKLSLEKLQEILEMSKKDSL